MQVALASPRVAFGVGTDVHPRECRVCVIVRWIDAVHAQRYIGRRVRVTAGVGVGVITVKSFCACVS